MKKIWHNSDGTYNLFHFEHAVRRSTDLANDLGLFKAKSILERTLTRGEFILRGGDPVGVHRQTSEHWQPVQGPDRAGFRKMPARSRRPSAWGLKGWGGALYRRRPLQAAPGVPRRSRLPWQCSVLWGLLAAGAACQLCSTAGGGVTHGRPCCTAGHSHVYPGDSRSFSRLPRGQVGP